MHFHGGRRYPPHFHGAMANRRRKSDVGKKTADRRAVKTNPRADAGTGSAWKGVRFALSVLVLILLFFAALGNATFDRRFVSPYTDFVTKSSAVFLSATGARVTSHAHLISSPSFAVEVQPVCNGLEVTAIYTAAVLAFDASLGGKAAGLAGGLSIIYLINIIRIAALFRIGERFQQAFEQVHYYYAQALVVVATVGVWLVWVHLFSQYGRKNRRPLSG